jgi:hypothetical protein
VVVEGLGNAWTDTGAQGRFSLPGLSRGSTSLMAVSPDGEHRVTVEAEAPATELVLRFERQLRVLGRVVDESGRPVTEFRVEWHEVTQPRGRFELVTLEGEGAHRQRVELKPGQTNVRVAAAVSD